MELVRAYLRGRQRALLFWALCGAIFAAAFALYRLPLAAVAYPALLCTLLGLGFLVWDFLEQARACRTLKTLAAQAEETAALPPARGLESGAYQDLVNALWAQLAALRDRDAARYRDMIDYYTVWAHQIKTPIAAMRLTLQNEDSPLARRLSGQLFRIEQYVEMVLAFLRLDAPASDYVFRPCQLDDVLRGAARRFAASFIERHVKLDFVPTGLCIISDEKWLGFVVEQLLSNALKYTPDGGCVTVSLAGPKLLCIADTGIGIAPEDLPRVFEKGFTGYTGHQAQYQRATGLGLYLCRRVCENLSIGIRIESQLEQGTRVLLDLAQYDLKAE